MNTVMLQRLYRKRPVLNRARPALNRVKPALISGQSIAVLKGLLLLGLLGLSACGSDHSAAPVENKTVSLLDGEGAPAAPVNTVPPSMLKVTGKLLNVGYLGNTRVCADINADGVCGSDEPSDLSDNSGNYALSVERGYRGISVIAQLTANSLDSASTPADPIVIQQGWVLSHLLEYDAMAQTVSLNVSPLTTVYYARMRQNGRNRLSNNINVFTRIVSEPNIDPQTQKPILAVDFDYVANPKNTLAARLRVMSDVLSDAASQQAAPLDMLTTTAMHAAWYSTYTGANATVASNPADASKIADIAATSANAPATYIARDYRYFRPNTPTALRLRQGLTETAGWLREPFVGALASVDRRATTLSNGAIIYKLSRWQEGFWSSLSVDEVEYLTTDRSGKFVVNGATDDLQPRTITAIDGNALTFELPNSGASFNFEVADSPGTHFFIEEWVGEQDSYANYYNGKPPAVPPFSEKTACAIDYPGTPQPNSANNLASTAISTWFAICFNYFTAEYYDLVKNDLALTGMDPKLPGANFYDATLNDNLLVAPLKTQCGSETNTHASITTAGKTHCNWAVDNQSGHVLSDLFSPDGIALNSWTKTYGATDFTVSGVTTRIVAGTQAQAGLPQQLTLRLERVGEQRSGKGTLTSPYGAWTAASNTALTEAIEWEIAVDNPNIVLISWPFRDIGDPRVLNTQASDGSAANAASLLPAGHFTATWNGNNFSLTPSTRTSPNYRKLAIVLVDGSFITGQYYGAGYTYNERYFTIAAMEEGIQVINYVFNRLYQTGFVDK